MYSALRISSRPLLATASKRTFASSSNVRAKDLIQDLYVKELKAYKPSPAAKDASSSVRTFSAPSAPKAPVVPTASELATELEAYAAEQVSVASAVAKTEVVGAEAETEGGDEYLKLVEADVKTEAAHH